MNIETWAKVWREGFAPQLTDAGLAALYTALLEDDPRLLQGATTSPPPLQCVQDWPVEACCPISFAGWQSGDGLETVGQVERFFAQACCNADQRLGHEGAVRWFLNWADDTPAQEMRAALLEEVGRELSQRGERIAVAVPA